MQSKIAMSIRDLWDVIRHVRDPRQFVLGLIPARHRKPLVLNDGQTDSTNNIDVSTLLNDLKTRLKTAAINDQGRVDYARLQGSDLHRELGATAAGLRTFDPGVLKEPAEKTAFWLNLYNVLAIHGVVELGVKKSVMEIPSFFGIVAYRIGEQVFTLDEIENGIMRANAGHPATKKRVLGPSDPRLAFALEQVDPRVHAALVCASKSCPPIRFYEPGKLHEQLAVAASNWVDGDVIVNETAKRVELPITYFYFRDDFGGEEGIYEFLVEHSTGDLKVALRSAMDNGYPLFYSRYDWSLNRIA
jgi:Protein of unknown function, DUF547